MEAEVSTVAVVDFIVRAPRFAFKDEGRIFFSGWLQLTHDVPTGREGALESSFTPVDLDGKGMWAKVVNDK